MSKAKSKKNPLNEILDLVDWLEEHKDTVNFSFFGMRPKTTDVFVIEVPPETMLINYNHKLDRPPIAKISAINVALPWRYYTFRWISRPPDSSFHEKGFKQLGLMRVAYSATRAGSATFTPLEFCLPNERRHTLCTNVYDSGLTTPLHERVIFQLSQFHFREYNADLGTVFLSNRAVLDEVKKRKIALPPLAGRDFDSKKPVYPGTHPYHLGDVLRGSVLPIISEIWPSFNAKFWRDLADKSNPSNMWARVETDFLYPTSWVAKKGVLTSVVWPQAPKAAPGVAHRRFSYAKDRKVLEKRFETALNPPPKKKMSVAS